MTFFFWKWENTMKEFEQGITYMALCISGLTWKPKAPDAPAWPGLVGSQDNRLRVVSPCRPPLLVLVNTCQATCSLALAKTVNSRKFFLRTGVILWAIATVRKHSKLAWQILIIHSFIHSAVSLECLLCARRTNESIADFLPAGGMEVGRGPADEE